VASSAAGAAAGAAAKEANSDKGRAREMLNSGPEERGQDDPIIAGWLRLT